MSSVAHDIIGRMTICGSDAAKIKMKLNPFGSKCHECTGNVSYFPIKSDLLR